MQTSKTTHTENFDSFAVPPPPGFPILRVGCRNELKNWNMPHCITPFWILFYNPTPGAFVTSGKHDIPLDKSVIVILPPFTIYKTRCENPCKHYFFWFGSDGMFATPKREPIILNAEPFTDAFHKTMSDNSIRRTAGFYALLNSILLSIPDEYFVAGDNAAVDYRIMRAIDIMHDMEKYSSNADVAAKLNMSETAFQHLFKSETGIPPHQYFRHLQLNRSLRLLSSGVSIKDVASKTGFADRYHFSKTFKNHFGITPKQWQQEHLTIPQFITGSLMPDAAKKYGIISTND